MAFQFKDFRATKPVVRLIGLNTYEVFFVVYDSTGKKHNMRYKAGINRLPEEERQKQARATADILWEALQKKWNPLTKARIVPITDTITRSHLN